MIILHARSGDAVRGPGPSLPRAPGVHDSTRNILRQVTRRDHERLDRLMARLDLSNRGDYGILLSVHYNALMALAGRWSVRDQPDFSGLLTCLASDLRALNCPLGEEGDTQQAAGAELPGQWGLAYVIRGSRLGSAILRQRVPAGHPTSYLEYTPILTWPEFLKQLDGKAQAIDPQALGQIIRGAKQAFAAFSAAAAGQGLENE
jgi:heme oxygenase